MSPDERSAQLASAKRKLEKCRDLASRPGEDSPWTGDEAEATTGQTKRSA